MTQIYFSLLQAVFSAWLFSQGNQTALYALLLDEPLLSVSVSGLRRARLIACCILPLRSIAGLEDPAQLKLVKWFGDYFFFFFLSLSHSAPMWEIITASELLTAVNAGFAGAEGSLPTHRDIATVLKGIRH